jgi:hypothetical protein
MVRFGETPLFVLWEATQTSDPVCAHCRASAAPRTQSPNLTGERLVVTLGGRHSTRSIVGLSKITQLEPKSGHVSQYLQVLIKMAERVHGYRAHAASAAERILLSLLI